MKPLPELPSLCKRCSPLSWRQLQVLKIKRVQNGKLWLRYCVVRRELLDKLGSAGGSVIKVCCLRALRVSLVFFAGSCLCCYVSLTPNAENESATCCAAAETRDEATPQNQAEPLMCRCC
jgi:hypothetical protein